MWIDNEYHIQTYEELLQCSMQKLDVPDGTMVVLDKNLVYQVRTEIMENICKDADIIAPYLNQFFIDESDKLVKDMVKRYIPEFGIVPIGKYEPYDTMESQDWVLRWLPQGLWEKWRKMDSVEEWLQQTPNIIHRG